MSLQHSAGLWIIITLITTQFPTDHQQKNQAKLAEWELLEYNISSLFKLTI